MDVLVFLVAALLFLLVTYDAGWLGIFDSSGSRSYGGVAYGAFMSAMLIAVVGIALMQNWPVLLVVVLGTLVINGAQDDRPYLHVAALVAVLVLATYYLWSAATRKGEAEDQADEIDDEIDDSPLGRVAKAVGEAIAKSEDN